MMPLLRPVMKMRCSIPAARASSTTCWISGRSTTVSISFGIALVAGRKRVPRPATGKTALRIGVMLPVLMRRDVACGGGKVPALISGKPYLMPYEVERRRGLMQFVKQALFALVPLAALSGVALAQDDRFPN